MSISLMPQIRIGSHGIWLVIWLFYRNYSTFLIKHYNISTSFRHISDLLTLIIDYPFPSALINFLSVNMIVSQLLFKDEKYLTNTYTTYFGSFHYLLEQTSQLVNRICDRAWIYTSWHSDLVCHKRNMFLSLSGCWVYFFETFPSVSHRSKDMWISFSSLPRLSHSSSNFFFEEPFMSVMYI